MTLFSDRIGATAVPTTIQVDSMSRELRNSLWNLLHNLYQDNNHDYWQKIVPQIAQFFRKVPIDELPYYDHEKRKWLKEYFFGLQWYDAYNLLEFVVRNHAKIFASQYGSGHPVAPQRIVETANTILERELSAYRFVQGFLTPLSNHAEIEAIESAVSHSQNASLGGAALHIRSSIQLLGSKPNPDYRNAIKEAISAVESVAKQIMRAESATLDSALKQLSAKSDIHGALASGFLKLYGYTSDESGIRHAALDEPNVGFAEAKYMVVSCSAFVYYLIQKAESAGLLK